MRFLDSESDHDIYTGDNLTMNEFLEYLSTEDSIAILQCLDHKYKRKILNILTSRILRVYKDEIQEAFWSLLAGNRNVYITRIALSKHDKIGSRLSLCVDFRYVWQGSSVSARVGGYTLEVSLRLSNKELLKIYPQFPEFSRNALVQQNMTRTLTENQKQCIKQALHALKREFVKLCTGS